MGTEIAVSGQDQILERFEEYALLIEPDTHVVRFVVKRIVGEHVSGGRAVPGSWTYQDINCEFVDDFDSSETFLSGSIKWDGCSNWNFHTDQCMRHFCGRDDATSIGRLMTRLYEIAAERVPHYDREIAC